MKENLQSEYRNLFARLGFPLSKRDGIPEAQITKSEAKLGIRLPNALRDYYLVAGRERILNQVFNRLCLPTDCERHAGKLIFMLENQTVVVWGIAANLRPSRDPIVFQAPLGRGAPDKWHSEETRCSVFLKFMMHLQAAYGGGMPCTASAASADDLAAQLKTGWFFGGEVNGMRAYSRERQAICIA